MKIYRTETQQAYDELMTELEGKGCEWMCGEKPTQLANFRIHGKDTYFYVTCGGISLSDGDYFNKNHKDEPIIEYKSKGDNQMLNTECKQCHKKWHHDNAKYCSMCGKKLIAEPDFKVGDYVTYEGGIENKIAKIDSINEDELHGLWYGQENEGIRQDWWFKGGHTVRHSTPEEIVEYEVALEFHKHGRKPFEVKKGDILRDDEGNIFSVNVPSVWNKENFTSGDYTFLKTAEEVNEWLGADDE